MTDIATCPYCRQSLRVPPSLAGRRVKCPACTRDFDPVPPGRRRDDEEDDDAPRPRDARWDDEPRPPRLREERDDDDDEDYPRYARSRRDDYDRRPGRPKPGKVQAVAIMMLVGGILNCLLAATFIVGTCGFGLLWPGTYLAIVTGILCLIKASALLGDRASREAPPTAPAIMQIVCIINLDVVNLTLGIVELVMMNDAESREYLRP